MSLTEVMLAGTLQADGTLILDTKPNLPAGRVQVIVRAEARSGGGQSENLLDFVQRVCRESQERGHQFMTEQEITAWMEEQRADDNRIEEAYSQAD